MIRSLQLRIFHKKTAAIFLYKGIHISTGLFVRRRIPRASTYESGMKHWKKTLSTDTEFPQELKNEYELDDDFDFTKTEEAYDLHVWEQKKYKKRVRQKITVKKFFAPRPQPLMLTWNERQCIKYLHHEDPVQWNIKSLSEHFPATPVTIKKIIKSRKKISPERAKLLDSKALENWELLAKGKLDADPPVLEHLKKFINRREILLHQINNNDFYLPEIKKEPVWNQGEMNKILEQYDKALSKLIVEAPQSQNLKALNNGVTEEKSTEKEKISSLDLSHKKIEMEYRKEPELKESFIFGRMINAFKKNITLEELEDRIMKKTEKTEKLDLIEKGVLDSKLGINGSENYRNINKNSNLTEHKSSTSKNAEKEGSSFTSNSNNNLKLQSKIYMEADKKYSYDRIKTTKIKPDKLVSLDIKSHFTDETGIGELLNADLALKKTNITEEKSEIDFSDPVRLHNEKVYYDKQVSDIKNTAFWNNSRKSQEKALAESSKQPIEIPAFSNKKTHISKTTVLSADTYPKRIKIPRHQRGTGLTFRIKDCYYDDDGEFLYRVPGMIK